jgi:hypothetical protein
MTEQQQEIFLSTYRKTGALQKSCSAAGITKRSLEAFTNSIKGEDFADAFQNALEEWQETIEAEISRRAIEGVDKGVYFKGVLMDTEKEYSDSLLIKMAESTIPKYSKKLEIDMKTPIQVVINRFTDEEELG